MRTVSEYLSKKQQAAAAAAVGAIALDSNRHHENRPTGTMGSRNRVPSQQIRDDFLLETNFDDDGTLTRAYNTLNNGNQNGQNNVARESAGQPLQQRALSRRSMTYPSNLSVDRYSDNTIHGRRSKGLHLEYE